MRLSSEFYDVAIVGAGPAGSSLAYELASSGYNVAVFEEKSAPGLNVCCTGIISTECFNSLGLDKGMILTEVNSARFFSPSGRCLRLHTEKVQAYVINRRLLDQTLATKAQSRGVKYFFSSPVIDIVPGHDGIQAETLSPGGGAIFSARAVVLANGFRPRLSLKVGLGEVRSFLVGAQAEVEATNVDELEVYFGRGMGPGSFAWLVPISTTKAYVGLLATSQAKMHLQRFLLTSFCRGRIVNQDVPIEQKAIPIGSMTRIYGDRILAIGDAAGQVKPTTGGGIYFGHIGAKIAAAVLDEALNNDDLTASQLSRYQKLWKKKMGKELSRGHWARWAYVKLSDRQVEGIFNVLASDGAAQALLNSGDFSFDWHSKLVLSLLRRSFAYPLPRIRRFLFREAYS